MLLKRLKHYRPFIISTNAQIFSTNKNIKQQIPKELKSRLRNKSEPNVQRAHNKTSKTNR